MHQLILGSQSPRRRALLSLFHVPFTAVSPDFDESSIPFESDPVPHVTQIAEGKGKSLLSQFPDTVIVTADTIVYCENQVFGKPSCLEEARKMLQTLGGKRHEVYSAVSIHYRGKSETGWEKTSVEFIPLNNEVIDAYHQRIEWKDKAGAYAIQGEGGLIIRRIDGCYYNVMGLPIHTLAPMLEQFGIQLWDTF